MKRFLCFVLSLILLLGLVCYAAAESEEDEIEFSEEELAEMEEEEREAEEDEEAVVRKILTRILRPFTPVLSAGISAK